MITVDKEALQKVIDEMKRRKSDTAAAHAALVKKYTARGLLYAKLTAEEKALRVRHAHYKEWYSVGKHIPVKLLDFVIDYRYAQPFLNKLRGYHITVKAVPQHGYMLITYTKRVRGKLVSGVLQLYDLTHKFTDLEHIPTAKLEGVEMEGVTV